MPNRLASTSQSGAAEEGPRGVEPLAALWTIFFCAFAYMIFSIRSGLLPDAQFDPLSAKRLVAIGVGGCFHLAATHGLKRTTNRPFGRQLLHMIYYTLSASLAVLLARMLYSVLVDSTEAGLRAADGLWLLTWTGYFAASLVVFQLQFFASGKREFRKGGDAERIDSFNRPALWTEQKRRPTRVLRIVLVQAGLGAGGTEKILSLLATHLGRQGHNVTMLAIGGRPSESFYSMSKGVTLRTMEDELGKAATRSTIRRIAWLRRTMREVEADFAISFLTKINVQVAVACMGLGIARIASERNNFRQQAMSPLWRPLMPVALATADVAVMQSRAARAALPAWVAKRAVVIPNPAPDSIHSTLKEVPPRRLVAVGRLTKQKGFDVLLHAVHKAREQGCDLRLTVYGEGEDRERLSGLAQSLGLSGYVGFPGLTRQPHDWIQGGGIFVLSSRFEGFANVLVEAMAAGFAVVSTACDWGPQEIVTHGRDGLLVPPADADSLAEALIRVWEDDALRVRLAKAAVQRAADFSEARILSEWDAAVAKALSSRMRDLGVQMQQG